MKSGPWLRRALFSKIVLVSLVGSASFLILVSLPTGDLEKLPTFAEVRENFAPSDVWILDRHGVPLEAVRVGYQHRSLDWVKWEDVSSGFKNLLIRAEDRRFYRHPGVDARALASAAINLARTRVGLASGRRGASTITMQLINYLARARPDRPAAWRKLRQMALALRLERSWSKSEIIEAYVNFVPIRGELEGLRAASVGYFAKEPMALTQVESALLIASLRAPNASVALTAKRACSLLVDGEDCKEAEEAARNRLAEPYHLARARDLVPVLSRAFVVPGSPSRARATTLDAGIQKTALSAVREQLQELKERNVRDAAVVVLDTKSGEILAYVGNGGPAFSSAAQIDGAQTRRQAGSTLKPFVYATAFALRLLDLSSLVEDSPEDLAVGGGGVYSPRNYDDSFHGLVSAGEALASSLNVPAVRILELVKEGRVLQRLRELGFSALRGDEAYGPSLALGTVDVTLLELTRAYRGLSLYAEGGAGSQVFLQEAKRAVFASLSRPEYRRFTFGLDSVLSLPFPAAVKTGTSKDMRDNWCLGYTSEYTVGVWVGNFDGAPMWNVSGITGAAPIWRRIMLDLHRTPPRDEIMAYVPPNAPLVKPTLSRIRYPRSGMLVGLDPDIPSRLQKLPIKIEHPQPGQRVYMDGRFLDRSKTMAFWRIVRGPHQVELRATNGDVVDKVRFVVR